MAQYADKNGHLTNKGMFLDETWMVYNVKLGLLIPAVLNNLLCPFFFVI